MKKKREWVEWAVIVNGRIDLTFDNRADAMEQGRHERALFKRLTILGDITDKRRVEVKKVKVREI